MVKENVCVIYSAASFDFLIFLASFHEILLGIFGLGQPTTYRWGWEGSSVFGGRGLDFTLRGSLTLPLIFYFFIFPQSYQT